jgi:hypothetical protein
MFGNIQNATTNGSQDNILNDVWNFLCSAIKTGISIKEDVDFQSENRRVLNSVDLLTIVRRLGRTEERYADEIKVFNAILSAKDAVNPPPLPTATELLQNYIFQQAYLPTYHDLMTEHKNILRQHTDNIPYYIAIKFGKEQGIDWILDKLGDAVKKWFHNVHAQTKWWSV